MTTPTPPAPQPARRWTRVARVLVPVTVLGIILLTVGTVGFIEYSAQPGFCNNCHNMVPYYDSWAESSHREVPCIACHYAPGIKAEAMGKLQAANQVVKYLTGSYGMRPWAEIDDAACLRSGCHSERKVEGALDYNGVTFEHADHLGELRRGKQLRCTSCHSQIVQGEHLAVTASTCFLCHFKDRMPGAPLAGCVGCHPNPARVTSANGYVVEHARYVNEQVSCISCHAEVTRGDGAAELDRCYVCHNEPDRIAEFDNPPRMHQIHITDHKIECAQCHSLIEHQITETVTVAELDCKSCHTAAHDAQLRLYAGIGGHQTAEAPSKMFQARVSCLGCHEQSATLRGHEKVQVAGEASCLSCHGIRYNSILPNWQREMDRRVSRVAPVVAQARSVLNASGSRRSAADSLLRLAEDNLALVRNGRPAHNVAFADDLLRAALTLTRDAMRTGRLPYAVPAVDLGPRIEETSCTGCHLGVERQSVGFKGGGRFPHEPHAVAARMGCGDCHTPFEEHGGTRLASQASCQGCHHRSTDPVTCATCHRGAAAGRDSVLTLPGGVRFEHGLHKSALPECTACHAQGTMKVARFECASCHDQHHEAGRACQSCHQDNVKGKHASIAKDIHDTTPPCVACHEEAAALETWSPATCTSCHVSQATGHHERQTRSPRGCETCHDLKATLTPPPPEHARSGGSSWSSGFFGVGVGDGGGAVGWPGGWGSAVHPMTPRPQAQDSFPHQRHRALPCIRCHTTREGHGGLAFQAPQGCNDCHHQRSESTTCTTCHRTGPQPALLVPVTVAVQRRPPLVREVSFDHALHGERACQECHTTPGSLAPDSLAARCTSCHEAHHGPERQCASCHQGGDLRAAHRDAEASHRGCDACHRREVVAALTPTRPLCGTCHVPQRTDHYQRRECTVCHFAMPPERLRPRLLRPDR